MSFMDEVTILRGLRLGCANFSRNYLGYASHPIQRQKQPRHGGSGCSPTSYAECLMNPWFELLRAMTAPPR